MVSMLLLLQICDELRMLQRWAISGSLVEAAAHRLRELTHKFMVAFVKAYGRDTVRYKHHQVLHLWEQILRHGMLLSCFVCERKNKGMKTAMQNQQRLGGLTDHGMKNVVNAQLYALSNAPWLPVLDRRLADYPELARCLGADRVNISQCLRWRGVELTSNAIVFLDHTHTYLVVVVAGLEIDGSFALLVRCCARVSGTQTASRWRVDPDVTLRRLVDEPVIRVAFHRFRSSEDLEILH